MWKLAFRNIFRHRVRTVLTLAAIVLGVISLILSGGFIQDTFIELRESTIHSQLGHIQVYRVGYFHTGQDPFRFVIDNPEEHIKVLQELEGVVDVLPRLNFSGLLSNGRTQLAIFGEGVDPHKEAALGSYITILSGRELTQRDTMGIMVGRGVAHALKLKVGDQVTILLNTTEGALNSLEFELTGIFETVSKDYDDRAIRIPLEAAQALLATNTVHSLVFSLKDSARTDNVIAELRQRLDAKGFEIKAWYELADFYQKTVELYERLFGVLQIIILSMVFLSVVNSVNMTSYERTGEYGTLMALGNRGGTIFQLVVIENVILGFLGSALGIMIGISLAKIISAVGIPMPPPPNGTSGYIALIRVVPSVVWTAGFIGFMATCLAALLPARHAARLPIVEALRQN